MNEIELHSVWYPSEDVVAREIEREIIIIPLKAGIGDLDDDLFTLNETGREIWKRLDGSTTVQQIIHALREEYHETAENIQRDVLGLLAELCKLSMISRKDG